MTNKTREDGSVKLTELSSNPDIAISRIQGTTALVEDKHWEAISDHRPLISQLPMKLDISEVRTRVAKALFYSPATRRNIEGEYRGTIPVLTEKLRTIAANEIKDENQLEELYNEIQISIVAPWEKK